MKNTGAYYCIGNGKIGEYLQNGDVMQVFGPPYSSPSVFKMMWESELERTIPTRQPKTAIWHYSLVDCAEITDFAVPNTTYLVRHIQATQEVTLSILQHDGLSRGMDTVLCESIENGFVITVKLFAGNSVYNHYPIPFEQFYKIKITGNAVVTPSPKNGFHVTIKAGITDIIFVGGASFPECDTAYEKLADTTYDSFYQQTEQYWNSFFNSMDIFHKIPASTPRYNELIQAIESTAVNILSQQAEEGGVLAGYNYHLGYVRDQYGVFCSLLRMGLYKQGRKILEFYMDVFHKNGKIMNAQGMGIDGLFHFAENDEVEITGYLLVQFFKFAEITGEKAILKENIAFLQWLYDCQVKYLAGGMIPFNGDETYIAGGILPRTAINDGSAEATMLFVKGGKLLYALLEEDGVAPVEMKALLEETESRYRSNFIRDGRYVLNNPDRRLYTELPKYRYGICNGMGHSEGCECFGWTKLSDNAMYFCPTCLSKGVHLEEVKEIYEVQSALLMPAYLGLDYIGEEFVKPHLQRLEKELETKGAIYSIKDKPQNVGYDYGLILYNFTKYGSDKGDMVYNKLLDMIDECGAWAEYYVEEKPCNTRYRPWESGINIDALINYVLNV